MGRAGITRKRIHRTTTPLSPESEEREIDDEDCDEDEEDDDDVECEGEFECSKPSQLQTIMLTACLLTTDTQLDGVNGMSQGEDSATTRRGGVEMDAAKGSDTSGVRVGRNGGYPHPLHNSSDSLSAFIACFTIDPQQNSDTRRRQKSSSADDTNDESTSEDSRAASMAAHPKKKGEFESIQRWHAQVLTIHVAARSTLTKLYEETPPRSQSPEEDSSDEHAVNSLLSDDATVGMEVIENSKY